VSRSPEYLPSRDSSISMSRIGIRALEPENIYCVLNNLEAHFIAVGMQVEVHSSLNFSVCGLWKVDDPTKAVVVRRKCVKGRDDRT
jgi:hypothetical protein